MACRDSDAPTDAQVAGGKVNFLGTAEANIQDVHPGFPKAGHQRTLDRLAGQTDIVADHHPARVDYPGVGAANAPGDVLIELARHLPTHIVGLETGQFVSHVASRESAPLILVNVLVNVIGGGHKTGHATAVEAGTGKFVGHDTARFSLALQGIGDLDLS